MNILDYLRPVPIPPSFFQDGKLSLEELGLLAFLLTSSLESVDSEKLSEHFSISEKKLYRLISNILSHPSINRKDKWEKEKIIDLDNIGEGI